MVVRTHCARQSFVLILMLTVLISTDCCGMQCLARLARSFWFKKPSSQSQSEPPTHRTLVDAVSVARSVRAAFNETGLIKPMQSIVCSYVGDEDQVATIDILERPLRPHVPADMWIGGLHSIVRAEFTQQGHLSLLFPDNTVVTVRVSDGQLVAKAKASVDPSLLFLFRPNLGFDPSLIQDTKYGELPWENGIAVDLIQDSAINDLYSAKIIDGRNPDVPRHLLTRYMADKDILMERWYMDKEWVLDENQPRTKVEIYGRLAHVLAMDDRECVTSVE